MNLVGKMLAGRYEILEEIGKGGMAHVYKARCHFLNRFVAIKVLKEELRDDKEFVHRFNTEAQAAARISNPHVVSIFDVGFENGLYYIVMEYVEGITLKEYIAEKHALPWRQAAEFAAQICEGLQAAHKCSVIHRDIKPQNIIMANGGTLKVTDFGIARATSQATTTATNSTIGTVHYLSPEQARGGYTNEKTDIYSLGVVLYEMLTGRLPFDDSTPVAIAIKHIRENPVLPRILNNDIPEAMEHIVLKAMNKEQDARYASAGEFLRELNAVIENPNVKLAGGDVPDYVEDDEDIDVTRKRSAIDDSDIDNYDKTKRSKNSEYEKYADKIDEDMEERKLRNIDRKRAIREQKKKERRITIAAIAAAVLVIAGMGVAFSAMSGGGVTALFKGSEKVEIPNVLDMKLDAAQKQYKGNGFSIVKQSERASDKEAGTILEQDPPAGNDVTKRDDIIIRVVVSAGSEVISLEDYTGLKIDDAKRKISEKGLKVNIVEKESSSEEKDKVISQEPTAGKEVAKGGLVTLYVSRGDKTDDGKNDGDKGDNKDDKDKNNNSNSNTNNSQTTEPEPSSGSQSNQNQSGNSSTGSSSNGNTPSTGGSGTGGSGTGGGSDTSSGGEGGSGNTGSSSGSESSSTPGISD